MQRSARTLRSALVVLSVTCGVSGLAACKGKTPVPFKREPGPSEVGATPAALASTSTAYPDQTHALTLETSTLARSDGVSFRAALPWDLDPERVQGPDALVVSSDAQGRSSFETWGHDGADASALQKRASLPLAAAGTGCNLDGVRLDRLGPAQVLAVLDLACAQDPAAVAVAPAPANDAPPAPASVSHEIHQLVVDLEGPPRRLLHVASLPASDPGDGSTLSLTLTSLDQDKDGHADVQASAELAEADGSLTRVPLVWLNRPSGLARERAEPELSLTGLADEAMSLAEREPIDALPVAQRVLTVHRALCQESGAARLIVDESVGIACGPSAAAGKAAVVRVLALAKQQQLLPALAARAQLDTPAYRVEPADRERVAAALATIRGQTSYAWQRGPDLAPPTSPKLRLPALGFIDDDQLIMRGPVAYTYDLRTRAQSPTSIAQGVVLSRGDGGLALVDILSDCDGHYLRSVPESTIVAGVVAATRGTDHLLGTDQANRPGCTQRTRRSDHAGFVVLGLSAAGAVVAQGLTLRVVPLGPATSPRVLAASEPAPALLAPGALAQSGLRHALATSEGVAIIERGASPGTTLVRSPASCTGKVSDVALSPTGKRVAMVCSGHVYWAQQEVQATPPNSALPTAARPTTAAPAMPAQPLH